MNVLKINPTVASRFILFWCALFNCPTPCCFGESSLPQSQAPVLSDYREALSPRDFTFGYWLHGFRNSSSSNLEDLLCFETGYYGFALNIGALPKAKFALVAKPSDYNASLSEGSKLFSSAEDSDFLLELEVAGKKYRAVSCEAAKATGSKRLGNVLMWESGRTAQHFQVLNLDFKSDEGEKLSCSADLSVVAWPSSISFTSSISPSLAYVSGNCKGVVGAGLCLLDKPRDIPHRAELESEEFSVECWVKVPQEWAHKNNGAFLLNKNNHHHYEGYYGISLDKDKFVATLNIGGGGANEFTLTSKERSFKKDTWIPLVLSYDGSTMKFYMNGALQGEKSIHKKRVLGKGLLRLGKRADGNGPQAVALVDELRVWNRALSPLEIKSLAASPEIKDARQGLGFEESFGKDCSNQIEPPVWNNVTLSMALKTKNGEWKAEKKVSGVWEMGVRQELSLGCTMKNQNSVLEKCSLGVTTIKGESQPVAVSNKLNCFVATVKGLKRDWKTGQTDIRQYDDFKLEVKSELAQPTVVPFMLDFYGIANITGLCPILCDENGVPTGIPVQLSKNWHDSELGAYLRAYALLPVRNAISKYTLRVVYGFYGTLPAASHAQLSLIGYGGNGRWDQLAIGCWGETMCFDMDMSLTNVTVTDVRGLMLRNGLKGQSWNWTDCGWGGDWLSVKGAGYKLLFGEIKTAYISQGPCLTDVRYHGYYGTEKQVQLEAQVNTLRTDDYARTFQNLKYNFLKPLSIQEGWLFKMGGTHALVTPQIAYGNQKGLLVEKNVPASLKAKELFVDKVTLTGSAPWWIAFPGAQTVDGKNWGTGSRALIIRSYSAVFSGKKFETPTISMPVNKVQKSGNCDLDLCLVPPKGITALKAGDSVAMEVEWITLPRIADDYYGPNETFRSHLAENPRAWKTVFREAQGNDLKVEVEGGLVIKKYPLILRAFEPQVRVKIEGGVGAVPVVFEGLSSQKNWGLYQVVDNKEIQFNPAVHGHDFWQAGYDAASKNVSLSFNVPLDGMPNSEWVLKERPAP